MLYTSMPLERIYCDMNKEEEEQEVCLKEFPTANGMVYAEEVEGKYYIRNMQSSNMEDYLSEKYQIGAVYQEE